MSKRSYPERPQRRCQTGQVAMCILLQLDTASDSHGIRRVYILFLHALEGTLFMLTEAPLSLNYRLRLPCWIRISAVDSLSDQ